MRIVLSLVLGTLLTQFARADETPAGIQFPSVIETTPQPAPQPQPAPAVQEVPVLSPGVLYIIHSDTDFFLLASPIDSVKVTYIRQDPAAPGPVIINGIFIDGDGESETRRYSAPYVAMVVAHKGKRGRAELIAVPAGVVEEDSIVRQLVDLGLAPQPPPDPDPKPDDVDPIPTPAGFRVIFIYESGANLTREQLNVKNSTAIAKYLNTKCIKGVGGVPEWRRFDPDVLISDKESRTIADLWAATKPELNSKPQVMIAVDGKGTVFDISSMSETEVLALLKKYGGE